VYIQRSYCTDVYETISKWQLERAFFTDCQGNKNTSTVHMSASMSDRLQSVHSSESLRLCNLDISWAGVEPGRHCRGHFR